MKMAAVAAESTTTKMRAFAIFPGQGSQAIGMGRSFFDSSKGARELLQEASDRLSLDFKRLMFEEDSRLGQSEYTQPAIVLVSLMALRAFVEAGGDKLVKSSLGHSLGEFSALAFAGAFKNQLDVLSLVRLRGQLMQKACEGKGAGMLVSLGLSDDDVLSICDSARAGGASVWAANFNCDGQVVVAGIKQDLEKLSTVLKESGAKRAMLLDMSVASHCPLLDSATQPLQSALQDSLNDSFNPVISNVTATAYSSKSESLSLLAMQLVSPVLYSKSIRQASLECDVFVEFGAKVLSGLNKKITDKPTLSINDMSSLELALKELL